MLMIVALWKYQDALVHTEYVELPPSNRLSYEWEPHEAIVNGYHFEPDQGLKFQGIQLDTSQLFSPAMRVVLTLLQIAD